MQPLADEYQLPTGKLLCLLAVYFVVHVAVRVTLSDSLELDEAEQLVLGQTLGWGYGTKPPLYSWLQIGFFSLLGPGVLALSLFKNLLLFATYLCTFLAARQVTGRGETALIAALSLLMIPQIAWESQRDLTHSVLATTLAALTLYLFLRLCDERRTVLYLAFGAVAGLGFLAKFNGVILPLTLIAAALSLPALRPVVLDRRSLLSLTALLGVTSGYLYWFATHREAVLAQTGTFRMQAALPYWQTVVTGNASLVSSVLAFAGVAGIIILAIFWRPGKPAPAADPRHLLYRLLLGRALLATLIILELMVLLFRATYIKDRWLQPVLFYAPVWLVLMLAVRPGKAAVRAFLSVILVIGLTVLLLFPAKTMLAAQRDKFDALNMPFNHFADQFRQRGFVQGLILAESGLVAGNLHLQLPESTVIAAGLPLPDLPPTAASCLLVWDAGRTPQPPQPLLDLATGMHIAWDDQALALLEAPYHYAGEPPRMARLGTIPCQPMAGLSKSTSGPALH